MKYSSKKKVIFPARSSIRLTIGDDYDISVKLEPIPDQTASGAGLLRSIVELVNAGKFAEGIAKAGDGIGKEPANAILYYYRGYCQEKTGNTAAAMADYGKAVELKADSLQLAGLAKLQARQGEYAKAAENYKQACALAPANLDALYNYGVCLVNLGNNAEAKNSVREAALASDASHPEACYQLGLVLLGLGEMAKAKECLQTFLSLDPDHKDAATARAIIESLKIGPDPKPVFLSGPPNSFGAMFSNPPHGAVETRQVAKWSVSSSAISLS
ncbi:MAG: tetratricopeptide repeat protein [Desulfobacterales bacterium]|nr:tetratricopeptide repeat protein [Desulfobacterales bacterium]